MRGAYVQQGGLFSYVSVESRIPVRTLLDEALASMTRDLDRVYAEGGRSSVPPERLVRALVLRVSTGIQISPVQATKVPTRSVDGLGFLGPDEPGLELVFQAIGVAADVDGDGVVQDAIEDRGSDDAITEHLAPGHRSSGCW